MNMSKEISKKNKADQRWILEDNNKPAFPRGNRTWLCLHNYPNTPYVLDMLKPKNIGCFLEFKYKIKLLKA